MKRMGAVLAVALGVWNSFAAGQGQDNTKPILDKAVKALGGADKQKLPGLMFDTQAKITIGNDTIDLTGSWSAQGFDKVNGNVSVTVNGMQNGGTVVMNGAKLWALDSKTGKTEQPPADIVPSIQAIFQAVRFAQRPGLLTHKDLKLSSLGELLVNNVSCVGLKIEQKGHKEVSLYFDKATGLPAKAEITIKEGGGGESNFAFLFSEYKEIEGVKHFTKMIVQRNQQQVVEMEFTNIRLAEEINPNLFMKP
jgi:hypothetical protein